MSIDDLLQSGAVIIQNLTINNYNNTGAKSVVIGDGATVNNIEAQPLPESPRRAMIGAGSGYQYTHCAPLDPAVGQWYRDERQRADREYAESLGRR
jgi:hypothetical protein